MSDLPEGATTPSPAPERTLLDTDILSMIITFLKSFGIFFSVWILGYFHFSISWIVLGIFLWLWREKQRKERELKTEIAHTGARDEKAAIIARVEDLPSWVYFPDTERAEWLNKIIKQMWPYINTYAYDLLKTSIEPSVRSSLPSYLQAFRFETIVLGDNAPRIGGIKVYKDHVHRDEIIMDMDIMYAGDGEIEVRVNRFAAGIKDIMLNGRLRIIMRPLIPVIPLMGGVTVFFLSNPTIDFNLTRLADVFDIPGLSDMLRKIVQDQIANILVLPNKFALQLAENIDLSKLRYPQPDGVLRISGIACRDLRKADIGLLGMGKSDPYVVIHVGAQQFKTKTINNKVDPVWTHIFEAIVDQSRGQSVEIEVYDEDPGSKDDFLGRITVDIYSIARKGFSEGWLPLEDTPKGSIKLHFQWLSLTKNHEDLKKQLIECQNIKTAEQLSSALLMVYVDSAKNLPNAKRTAVEPSPYIQLTLGNRKVSTSVKADTNDPVWEENFKIMVSNPELQDLNIEVLDKKSGKSLGHINLPLQRILFSENMEIVEPFALRESGAGNRLHMRLKLRILKSGAAILKQHSDSTESYQRLTPERQMKKMESTFSEMDDPEIQEEVMKVETALDQEIIPKSESLVNADNVSRTGSVRHRNISVPPLVLPLGKIEITVHYNSNRGLLSVVIHKIANLHPYGDQSPDPYVTVYLLPERSSHTKRKTAVVKNSLNPSFEESMEYNINQNDLKKHTLEITVKTVTSRFSRGKGIIGQVKIDLSEIEINKSFTEWFDIESSSSTSSRSSKGSNSPKTPTLSTTV